MDTLNTTAIEGGVQLTGEKAAEFNNRTLLERLKPELQIMKYGEKNMTMPKHAGDLAKWRRFNSLAVNTTEITEGVTPAAVNITVSVVSATVKEYGSWCETTDVMDLEAIDPVMTEYAEILGENAGESLESVVNAILYAGTNAVFPVGATQTVEVASTMKIAEIDVLKIRRALKRAKVKPIKLPNGKTGYLAFIHTDVATDLMQLDAWVQSHKYVDNAPILEGSIGEWHGIYFVEYDLAVKSAGAGVGGTVDVYKTLVIGKGAFGVPDIEGSSKPEMVVKRWERTEMTH